MAHSLSTAQDGHEVSHPNSSPPLAHIESPQSQSRALIGWFSEPEALQVLVGQLVGPLERVEQARALWSQRAAAVASRRPYRASKAVFELGDQRLVEQIQGRADIQAALSGLDWKPTLVDLKKVLSYQRTINLQGLEERAATARESEMALLNLCLPSEVEAASASFTVDPDQRGLSLVSRNPNLRFGGLQVGQELVTLNPNMPPRQMLVIRYLISMQPSYLQVVHYQGRYVLRDGYHRAAGLLRLGISIAPCLLIEAHGSNDLGLQPGLFTPDIFMSVRPPRLVDFWDDDASCEITQPTTNKIVRVQGSEFFLPR